jgi:hypothetical protein
MQIQFSQGRGVLFGGKLGCKKYPRKLVPTTQKIEKGVVMKNCTPGVILAENISDFMV